MSAKWQPDRQSGNSQIRTAGAWTSLAVQWLRLHTSTAGGTDSIPGQGTKIPQATWHSQKKKKNIYIYIYDFPGGPVVKNLPCNAKDVGSIPSQGTKIPHAIQQLSQRATTRESMSYKEYIQHATKKILHAATKT